MRTTAARMATAALVAFFAAACIDKAEADVCEPFGWDAATPGEVVCPETDACSCKADYVCCVTLERNKVEAASCSSPADCAGLAFICDGPEDCGATRVCCSAMDENGGSSCEEEADCVDDDRYVMCRGDSDCPADMICEPAGEGAYFEALVGYCAP